MYGFLIWLVESILRFLFNATDFQLHSNMSGSLKWEPGIEGDFRVHKAVVAVMPRKPRIVAAESCGIHTWAKTAKVSAVLLDGSSKRYFLKVSHLKYI